MIHAGTLGRFTFVVVGVTMTHPPVLHGQVVIKERIQILDSDTGESGESSLGQQAGVAGKTDAWAPRSFIRLKPKKGKNKKHGEGYEVLVDVEAKAAKSTLPNNTVGSATIDVLFNSDDLTLVGFDYGALVDGYVVDVFELTDELGRFVRTQYISGGIGPPPELPGHDLDTSWDLLHRLHFFTTNPKPDISFAIRRLSLHIGFYDSHSNSSDTNVIVSSEVEIK